MRGGQETAGGALHLEPDLLSSPSYTPSATGSVNVSVSSARMEEMLCLPRRITGRVKVGNKHEKKQRKHSETCRGQNERPATYKS